MKSGEGECGMGIRGEGDIVGDILLYIIDRSRVPVAKQGGKAGGPRDYAYIEKNVI